MDYKGYKLRVCFKFQLVFRMVYLNKQLLCDCVAVNAISISCVLSYFVILCINVINMYRYIIYM